MSSVAEDREDLAGVPLIALDVGLLARLILVIVMVHGPVSFHLVSLFFVARSGTCAELVGE